MTVNEEKKAQVSKTIMKVNVFVFDIGVEHSHQLQLFPLTHILDFLVSEPVHMNALMRNIHLLAWRSVLWSNNMLPLTEIGQKLYR